MFGTSSTKLCLRCRIGPHRDVFNSNDQHRHGSLAIAILRNFSAQSPPTSNTSVVSSGSHAPVPPKRNTHIIRLHPSDYEGTAVGLKRLPLMARRGEPTSFSKTFRLRKEDDPPGYIVDKLAKMQEDVDFRPATLKRLWKTVEAENDIKMQV